MKKLIAGGLILLHMVSCDSEETQKMQTTLKQDEQRVVLLTTEDTLTIRTDFKKLNKRLDFLLTNATGATKQYNRFYTAFQNGGSQYKAYQTAKIVKETCERYSHDVEGSYTSEISDKLPHDLNEKFNSALANIESYYSTKGRAYSIVTDILNGDGDFKDVDKFKEMDELALESYNEGMTDLLMIESSFGVVAEYKKSHVTVMKKKTQPQDDDNYENRKSPVDYMTDEQLQKLAKEHPPE